MVRRPKAVLPRAAGFGAARLAVILALVLAGCSLPSLRTVQVFQQISYLKTEDGQGVREEMSLWAQLGSAEAFESLDSLVLTHESSFQSWTLDVRSWQRLDRGTELWVGHNHMRPVTSPHLPRGSYRLHLIATNGDRVINDLFLDSPLAADYRDSWPAVTSSEAGLTLGGTGETSQFWPYNAEGRVLGVQAGWTGLRPWSTLGSAADVRQTRSFWISTFKPNLGVSLLQGPFPFNPSAGQASAF